MSSAIIELRLEPLTHQHNRKAFDCAEASVSQYLQRTAMQAQESLRAATKVAVSPAAPGEILGYFTLIAIKIVDTEMPDDLARTFKIRNLTAGAPAVLLAQLGVDQKSGGIGLGTFLLKQAMRHAYYGALEVGGIALIVDAVNPEVATWYSQRVPDFLPLTPDGLRLILPMRTLAAAFTTPSS